MRRRYDWLLVLLIALPACDGDKSGNAASPTTSPTLTTPTTPMTAPVTQPAEFAPGAFVEGNERWLTGPAEPATKQFMGDCATLADTGWEATCGRARTQSGDAVWVHERKGEQERVLVYVNQAAGWDLVLRAADDTGSQFDATVDTVGFTDDGDKMILVRLRSADRDISDGIGPFPQVDLVEPSGKIAVHVVLRGGRSGMPDAALIPRRGLEIRDCPMDCVPTSRLRARVIAYRDGAWRVIDEKPGT